MIHNYIVVDLETTGNSSGKGDRIIQLSAVLVEKGRIADQFTSLVNPGLPIPAFIEELTGITDEMVADAPYFEEIAPIVQQLLDGTVFVAHNVLFDFGFLKKEMEAAGYDIGSMVLVDTVELARILLPTAGSYKLNDLTDDFALTHDRPHQADSDAYATAELLLLFAEQAAALPMVTLEELERLSVHLKSNISRFFFGLIEDKRKRIEDLPAHLDVYRGLALRKPVQLPEEDQCTNGVEKAACSYPDSLPAKRKLLEQIPEYVEREGQLEMMDAVHKAFMQERHALIEAGTGIGKSLGYLLPAACFAVEQKTPVVISTYTTHLQEQLMNEEFQRLLALFPLRLRTALLKGRSHYLSLLKFEQSLRESDPQYDTVLTKMQILVWLTQTETGDADELNLSSGGRLFWKRIKHDGWYTDRKKDPWLSRDFYLRARERAKQADIIITNHAMLLTDLIQDTPILPEYGYMIIDESHNLARAARSQLGNKLEYIPLKSLLGRLGTSEKKQLLSRLENALSGLELVPSVHIFEMEKGIEDLEAELDDLFHMLSSKILKAGRKSASAQRVKVSMSTGSDAAREWQPVRLCAERAVFLMKTLFRNLEGRAEQLREGSGKGSPEYKAFLEEIHGFLLEWQQVTENMVRIFLRPCEGDVIWLEGDERALPNSIAIQAQPVGVGDELANRLFSAKKSVILTSATMCVENSFSFIKSDLGLNGFSIIEKQIASPFDYKNNAKLMIPTDLPDIKSVSSEEYVEEIAGYIVRAAKAAEGRMLVLFTSYDMLRKTHNRMKDREEMNGIVLLAQGISGGSRSRLTKSFKQFEKAVLFGTSSFWEGVDIPGQDLSCLIMVRLPFSAPDDPVTAAMNDYVKKLGKNPFSAHSLPEAVIRFKQGFGRLIRRESDRGVAIVLDRRIDTAAYGRAFLRSLPPVQIFRGTTEETVEAIRSWL